MQDPILDLLGPSLIPVLAADIATGTPCHIHLALICVTALGTYPNQLSVILLNLDLTVKAADLAVIRFGV